ncbi:tripartite motif-containing protein 2-like [Asterias rubens]|uniref:tripartite motif-containing protein 2-like n=1 Tax=Asterias rubens TaxID=7604 RepID=UPI001455005C|nr:tripartite motif-containing protein 2-like [Asterias rubens]XP_033630145.1 tripartite motif-containing protein 2-like [Asterias rubens]
MASNITAQSMLEEISQGHLECPICSERFKQPKLLECSHSFCLQCLQNLKEKTPSTAILSCPVCRQDILLEENGIEGLKTDFKTVTLLEVIIAQEKRLKCQEEKQVPSEEHVSKCSKHTDKDLIMYCDRCNILICTTCIAKDHRLHPALEPTEALDKSKHHAEELLSKVRQCIETFNSAIQEIDMSRKTLDSMFAATKEKISKKADKEIAMEVERFIEEKQKLMDEAEQIYQDRVKTMETARATNCKEMTKAEHKQDEVNHLMDQGSCKIVQLIEKLLQDLEDYTMVKPSKVPDGLTYMNFKEDQKSLGRLVLQNKWTLKIEMKTYMNKAQQINRIFPKDVSANSNSDIFVSNFDNACWILIPAGVKPKSTVMPQTLSVEGLIKPRKMTVNNKDELIVLDNQTVKIFSGNYQLLHQFTPGQSGSKPSCIAVDDNNLIVVGYKNMNEISIHKPDGSLTTTIPAPGIGGYLTTYKQRLIYTNYKDKKLVSVGYNGDFVFSVDINQSGRPCGVCCDTDGCVYIAVWKRLESSTGDIHHYSPDGKYIGCIIKECVDPCGITFTPAGDLVVAAYKSVQIYHNE